LDSPADTEAIARSALTKASWRILPLLGLGFLMNYIDRLNVSFAAAQMNADLGFSATVYGLGSGLFFLSYALFEVPSGVMVTRVGARRWIARIMISWGLLAAGMMAVQTPVQFYVMRFLLGAAEAGYFPCALYCVSHWFPSAHRARATSLYYCFGGLGTIVMGLLSGWLLSLDGLAGLRGWQWLFLVEGLPAALLGLVILRWLPDDPGSARWLTPAERDWLASEHGREAEPVGKRHERDILAALRDRRVLHLAAIGFLTIGSFMSFQLFVPQLLAESTGLDAIHVGYLVSFAGVLQIVGMVAAGWHSDRLGQRFTHLLGGCLIVGLAFGAMALAPSSGVVMVAGYYVVLLCFNAITLATLVLSSEVVPRRAVGVAAAAVNTVSQLGVFLGPWLIGISRDATGSYHLGQMVLPVGFFLAILVILNLRRETRAAKAGARPAA
jgi:ACS family tartrate transporter-like MFS transporter